MRYFGSKIYGLPLLYDDSCGIGKHAWYPCNMEDRDFKHCRYPMYMQEFCEKTCPFLSPIDNYYFEDRHR